MDLEVFWTILDFLSVRKVSNLLAWNHFNLLLITFHKFGITLTLEVLDILVLDHLVSNTKSKPPFVILKKNICCC